MPDSSAWVRAAGGQGAYEAERSTTGATYTFDRFETEGGLSAALNATVKGWASVRHVQGRAYGASPTGGGRLDARGLGSTVGGAWTGANGAYVVGCFSYMGYTVDFASPQPGPPAGRRGWARVHRGSGGGATLGTGRAGARDAAGVGDGLSGVRRPIHGCGGCAGGGRRCGPGPGGRRGTG